MWLCVFVHGLQLETSGAWPASNLGMGKPITLRHSSCRTRARLEEPARSSELREGREKIARLPPDCRRNELHDGQICAVFFSGCFLGKLTETARHVGGSKFGGQRSCQIRPVAVFFRFLRRGVLDGACRGQQYGVIPNANG